MSRLRQHEESDEGKCVECKVRPSVGPCAACHGMVCGDCCSLVTDPAGKAVICISCTRMVADVRRKPLRRHSEGSKATAWMILAVLGFGLLAYLLR
jgi:hypothetical protein